MEPLQKMVLKENKFVIMKSLIAFFFFLIVFNQVLGQNLDSNKFNSKSWKKDKNGCNGYRIKVHQYIYDIQDSVLVGKSSNEILNLFGKPNRIIILSDSVYYNYSYWVTCPGIVGRSAQLDFMFTDNLLVGIRMPRTD
jgi:hypothetical protein